MPQEEKLKGIITFEKNEYAFILESNRLEILPSTQQQLLAFKERIWLEIKKINTKKYEIIQNVKLNGYLSTTESIEILIANKENNNNGYLTYPVIFYLKKSSNHLLSEAVILRLESKLLQYCINPAIFQRFYLKTENKQSKSIEYVYNEDLSIDLGEMNFKETKISILCNGINTIYSNSLTPFTTRLIVDFNLDKSLQFDDLYELILDINNSFQFIFRNKSLIFNSFELFRKTEQSRIVNLGDIHLSKRNSIEKDQINAFNLTYLKDKYANLLSEISKNNFTLTHIPFKAPNHYTISREIEIFAAFESEFKINYKDVNFDRSEEYIIVKNKCLEYMESLKEEFTGKKKKKCNEIIKGLNNSGHSLGQKFSHAIQENSEIIEQVFSQYKVDYNKENVNNITDRINYIRNALAHGHLDFEENPDDVFCFRLVEILIYTMQLKRLEVSSDKIKFIIEKLFNITL